MIRKRPQSRARLSEETLELFSYLDGELATEARRAFEHRLRAEPALESILGEWKGLFDAVHALEDFAPSPDFKVRVMAVLSAEPSVWQRGRDWLLGWGRSHHPAMNPFVAAHEGQLSPRQSRALAAYVSQQPEARAAARAWAALLGHLDAVPRLAPGAGFSDRVMAQLQVRGVELRQPSLVDRLVARLWPGRRERLAAISGVAVGPTAVVGATAYMILSNPLVTPANLLAFLWAKGSAFAGSLTEAAVGVVGDTLEGGAVGWAWSLFEGFALSGPLLAAGLVAFGALTALSSWILYRNVIKVTPMEAPYVTA
ncbi:MAG: hypothetical protein OEO23_03645 [Gemmatimonadota bacterium]|nr:hypothetical protein [Gemmatimonadota bacterium]